MSNGVKCGICSQPLGRARTTFDCLHAIHIICSLPLIKSGTLRCVECAKSPSTSPRTSTAILSSGSFWAQSQLVMAQMRENRSRTVVRCRDAASRLIPPQP